jgi:hypothetical protein
MPLRQVDRWHSARPGWPLPPLSKNRLMGESGATGPGIRACRNGRRRGQDHRQTAYRQEAVAAYLSDAKARGLAESTIEKLQQIFRKQLLGFTEHNRLIFLRDLNVRNMTEWRSAWQDKPLAKKKKFERVVGFFWFCVRQGWLTENPTATMGRVIAKRW